MTKDSNEVPVTPPSPEEPGIKKKVNGKAAATLETREEEFTYTVETKVPYDATAFEVTDTLVDVLTFSGDKGQAQASLDGKDLDAKQITDGQTIKVTLTEDQVKASAGKAVALNFKAKIKEGANLSAYIQKDKIEVPNKATYRVDFPGRPGVTKDSNEVPVTPPTPEEPKIKKDVNSKPAETLTNRNDVFTYNVNTSVPYDATAFEVTDTLVDVLEFAGDKGQATASLNGRRSKVKLRSMVKQSKLL
ncbi:isopeptide-forming domain-containing fimbrial protein [Streptococcus sanguinis]|uniref:Isopeptide-forming domain-containing fimbrial protein n=1 Tax=Streptococcus sanguinis TaxID=1305 RepID=A0A7Y0VBA4_STRSA|nr:isopeptide-forming domain-containing fimbrial protein [Streptococcus sanguinis]